MKLVTLTSNYAQAHNGQWLLRLAHVYEAGETADDLAQPVTIDLTRARASRPRDHVRRRDDADGERGAGRAVDVENECAAEDGAFTARTPFAYPALTLRPMEVRTFLGAVSLSDRLWHAAS